MKVLIRLLLLVSLFLSGTTFAQSSCGFFDPKVTFADGTKACLSDFSFFSRKGLITSPEYADYLAVARANSSSYAIAVPATPERCPFVQFTAWNWAGFDAQEALPKCNQRMQEATKRSGEFANCRCEVLIDAGVSKLTRAELTKRLGAFEHFLATGATQEQTRMAEARKEEQRKEEERLAKAKQAIEEQARLELARQEQARIEQARNEEEERLAKAKRAIEEQARLELARQEQARIEQARLDEERKKAEQASKPALPTTQPPVAQGFPASLDLADPSTFTSRVALVLGNSNYSGRWALKNPANDARAIAEQFKSLGFDVMLHLDVRVNQIGDILAAASQRMRPGGAFVFYYAGHGLQLRGDNYLPAVDANIRTQFDVPTQSLSLQQVITLADEYKAELRLMFLDACRDNPWQVATRSMAGGLAKVEPPKGTLISYATRPGSVAEDGDGANGIYTSHLLKHITTPILPVESVFKRVANDVFRTTNGRQEPWHEGNLRGEFAFVVKR